MGGAAALAAAASVPARGQGTNIALNKPAQQSSFSVWSTGPNDAEGAVNGVKNGSYHFHTDFQPNDKHPEYAWWQVDLQGVYTLSEVRIFNRMDEAARANTLQVLLSTDGNQWTLVYDNRRDNNGAVFGGYRGDDTKNDPLRVIAQVSGKPARFVRLQLAEPNFLHLDQVEVYDRPGGSTLPQGPSTIPAGNFHAIWSTDLGIGLYLGLVQTGDRVQGYYYGSDGRWYHLLTGTATGNVLTGSWDAGLPWFSGSFTFWLAADGRSFQAEATGADGFVSVDFGGQYYAAWRN
jgi:hypothetical protein